LRNDTALLSTPITRIRPSQLIPLFIGDNMLSIQSDVDGRYTRTEEAESDEAVCGRVDTLRWMPLLLLLLLVADGLRCV
jgi:hypothetical protein